MIPKLTRRASFGHAGMPLLVTAGVLAILTLLHSARAPLVSLISTMRPHTGGGQGQAAQPGRAERHLPEGLMALPPTGIADRCWRQSPRPDGAAEGDGHD